MCFKQVCLSDKSHQILFLLVKQILPPRKHCSVFKLSFKKRIPAGASQVSTQHSAKTLLGRKLNNELFLQIAKSYSCYMQCICVHSCAKCYVSCYFVQNLETPVCSAINHFREMHLSNKMKENAENYDISKGDPMTRMI